MRLLTLDAEEWRKLTDDIYKKDLKHEIGFAYLVHGRVEVRPQKDSTSRSFRTLSCLMVMPFCKHFFPVAGYRT